MPRTRLSLRRVREVSRLRWELGLSARQVARLGGTLGNADYGCRDCASYGAG